MSSEGLRSSTLLNCHVFPPSPRPTSQLWLPHAAFSTQHGPTGSAPGRFSCGLPSRCVKSRLSAASRFTRFGTPSPPASTKRLATCTGLPQQAFQDCSKSYSFLVAPAPFSVTPAKAGGHRSFLNAPTTMKKMIAPPGVRGILLVIGCCMIDGTYHNRGGGGCVSRFVFLSGDSDFPWYYS